MLTATKEQQQQPVITKEQVNAYLQKAGIKPANKGYKYIMDVLLLWTKDDDKIGYMGYTYDYIGELHNTTRSRAERAIRHAIEPISDEANSNWLARASYDLTLPETNIHPLPVEISQDISENARDSYLKVAKEDPRIMGLDPAVRRTYCAMELLKERLHDLVSYCNEVQDKILPKA